MALTRAQVEQVLVRRTGKFLAALGLSTDSDGANDDLTDPIAIALVQTGYSVSSIVDPTASEIAAVTSGDTLQFLDLAELRLLETLLSSNTLVDITVGPHSERLGQLQTALAALIKAKREAISVAYATADTSWGAVELIAPNFAGSTEYTA